MTLGRRFTFYLVLVHVALGAAAIALSRVSPWAVVGAESVLLLSLAWGIHLIRQARLPASQSAVARDLIRSREFTTRLLRTGVPEVDALVSAYNEISASLSAERVRAEEQQWFLSRVVAASPTGIVTFDLEGVVADVNPAAGRLLRADAATLHGRRIEALPGAFGPALCGIEPDESRMVSESGARRFRCRMSSFFDRGFARRFLLIEELSEELHRSEKAAYDKLVRVMAHEINNSVGASNSLLASSRQLAARLPEGERERLESALDLAIARGERLNAFLTRFADVVRLPAPRRQPVDLAALMRGALDLYRAGADDRIVWIDELPKGAYIVDADPYQFEQVLINVLKNAKEAVGGAGTVTVRTEPTPAGTRLVIKDSGPGIDPDVRPHLFRPFFSTKADGQGIGLTLAREILDAHGFAFGLDPDPAGGTRFWIEFPKA